MAEFGYRARLPQSVTRRYVPTQPGMGAAIGAGLAQLGQTVSQVTYRDAEMDQQVAQSEQRIAEIEQARARAAAVADGYGRVAALELDVDSEMETLRNNSQPGAEGFETEAARILNERWGQFYGTLPDDPEVRQQFQQMGARFVGEGIARARQWEAQQRTTHMGEQLETWTAARGTALARNPTADGWTAMVNDGDAAINVQLIPGTAKAQLQALVRQQATAALLQGTLDSGNHQAVTAMIESGAYDQWLGADGRDQWLTRANAVADVQAREAEAAATEARRVALERLQVLKVQITNGEDVPQADIVAAIGAAQAADVDQSTMMEFAYLGDSAVRRQAARGMATPAIEGQVQDLRARQALGQLSPEDSRQLEALENELDGRDTEAGTSLRDMIAMGPEGTMAAVQQLAGENVDRRQAQARQAGNSRLAIYAGIPAYWQRYAIEGATMRRESAADFLPPRDARIGSEAEQKAEVDRLFRGAIGTALTDQLIRSGSYEDMRDTALDLMAGRAGGWNAEGFRVAVQATFGQQRRPDGTLQGGIGVLRHGQQVELPPNWSQAEFDSSIQRAPFTGAFYSRGRPANADDVKRHFQMRYAGQQDDGRHQYLMVGPDNRPLVTADGSPYLVLVPDSPRGGR